MSLKAKVKVGNVNSLSSARYCAGMGVDFLGFRMGVQGLSPVAYKEIIEWISGPQLILEAHQDQSLTLEDITNNYPGHYIEINKDQLQWLENMEYEFILFLEHADIEAALQNTRGKTNLKYIELNVDRVDELKIDSTVPVILLLNDPLWLEQAVRLPVYGISLISGGEERPGLMDYAGVADVLEALEEQ